MFRCGRLAWSAALLLPLVAFAGESGYCRKVRARAAADAAQLMSPQLVLQGLRFPRNLAGLPLTELDGAGLSPWQARAGLAFAPLDVLKGLALTRASDDDCEQDDARLTLERYLENAEASARLPALRNQAAWLEATAPEWRALLAREEARFQQHVITLFELNQVRVRCNALERRLVQASGEAERIAARGYERPTRAPAELLEREHERALQLEQELGVVRSLSFWNFRLNAGLVASDRPLDWYGLAELTVHLGAPWDTQLEREAVAARHDELRSDRRGVEVRLGELHRQLRSQREQARHELALVDAQLDSVTSTRQTLERSEAPDVAFAVSLLTCDQWVAEADRVWLTAWISELDTLLPEDSHG
jgi:hypothetical protein